MNDQPRIVTRCPSCGHQTLFIGSGGHLTCSWLECRDPGVESAIEALRAERDRFDTRLNTPEIHDFGQAVVLEAAHQRERWAADDPRKGDSDWFWLIGYLAGKALHTPIMKDCAEGLMFAPANDILDKKLHRIITVAAACANWHAFVKALREKGPV